MVENKFSILQTSEISALIEFGNKIDKDINKKIRLFCSYLDENSFYGLIEYVPYFSSVSVIYDPLKIKSDEPFKIVKLKLEDILSKLDFSCDYEEHTVEIPVCYGGELGPDIEHVAKVNNLTVDEVIEIHSKGKYLVYMIGFAPGFPYLGGLSEKIYTPRRKSPRTEIPQGSVGIAGTQTGVYPIETPGGWQIIGRTPLKLFDLNSSGKTLLKCGDIAKGNLISITGANLSPTINDKKVPMGRPIYLKEDCILNFGRCISGCRCYLSVAGGFDIPIFMESKSTYLRAELGGKDGRALRKGDVLEIGNKSELSLSIIKKLREFNKKESFVPTKWYMKNFMMQNSDTTVIRVFEDRQFKNVSEESINEFFDSSFSVDTKSDRMGYRLNGPKIKFKENIEMISEEVSFGTIQIPPDGNPIILLADRATAGGYPKIAHVASYDIQKLVQLKPSDKIKFEKITLKEAENLYLKREKDIEELKKAVKLKRK